MSTSNLLIYIGSSLDLILAIVMIWLSSHVMVEKKAIKAFVPFFIIGIAYILAGVLSFYFLLTHILWFFKDLLFIFGMGWFAFKLKKYVSN